ncbi:NAD-dependent epimerase/dehydratase family protein [Mangrovivirga sp. M17]|uniref:NAD-dependent epimerase/dehydratase family protein n=1 Tax=Mangrovivirga halotolerans TaxID=2993936 RepID=A0ABT3RPD5_9BACT|nr:NAD-dependent epimerase/dehydratase family protein [Mangrovivirga halotolerans]MCX2743122.1 NAD-dependent epimerase/dehydratase family protein [Mangrovivirga halotolerans]
MILILGSSGLIGRYLTEKFSAEGHKVIATYNSNQPEGDFLSNPENVIFEKCPINDYEKLTELIKKAEYVIHGVAIVSFDSSEKEEMFDVNIKGTENVVNICLKEGNKPLLFISSVAALGRNKNASLLDESNKWEESNLNSNYAVSKYLAEKEVWRGAMEGLSVSIINPSTVLGVSKTSTSSMMMVDMLRKGSVFYPDGIMNWVDVRDLANITYKLYEEKIYNERFIISAGAISYKDLFKEASLVSGNSSPKFKVGKTALRVASVFDLLKSVVSGGSRKVTSETARLSGTKIKYSSDKIKQTLNTEFRSLQETLNWILNNDQK